ncbi:hypothetical protein ZWY2020_001135 [Hordeum vulgare]|nr:hypothetical protein ZWY2020_001135 [Hordeum vulgare]
MVHAVATSFPLLAGWRALGRSIGRTHARTDVPAPPPGPAVVGARCRGRQTLPSTGKATDDDAAGPPTDGTEQAPAPTAAQLSHQSAFPGKSRLGVGLSASQAQLLINHGEQRIQRRANRLVSAG